MTKSKKRPGWIPENFHDRLILDMASNTMILNPRWEAWEECLDAVEKALKDNRLVVYKTKFKSEEET